MKTTVLSVLLYTSETWNVTRKDAKRLAFHYKCLSGSSILLMTKRELASARKNLQSEKENPKAEAVVAGHKWVTRGYLKLPLTSRY